MDNLGNMIMKQPRWRTTIVLLILWTVSGVLGQNQDNSGTNDSSCSCSGSIAGAVIITTIVVLIIGSIWWCYTTHKKKNNEVKPDPEAASKAAYDNPQFQGDDLDSPDGVNQARIVQSKVASTATNTTSTLERGKSTLERVISAVIRGNRSGLDKKTKDDHNMGVKQVVTVPLQSHDFTGLGFTIHGNITQGLYVKEVMSRGPASQSGQVVPGDKVLAITVLTNHIVYEDALSILSYASPYPVLLNLEKGCGPISGFSTLNSKTKLNSSASSVALIHPSFKTQSFADFNKIKPVDVSRLKIGQNVAIPPKVKSSVNVVLDGAKIQKTNYVQRSAPDRHSERAIDVPGVEPRVKLPDVRLNMDTIDREDQVGLTNIQVHRSVSPSIEVATTAHSSITIPPFEDSKLSESTEKLSSTTNISAKGPKFGVKVFPDMKFLKKSSSSIDMETGEVEVKQPRIVETKSSVDVAQGIKSTIAESAVQMEIETKEDDYLNKPALKIESTIESRECDKKFEARVGLDVKPVKKIDLVLDKAEADLPVVEIESKLNEGSESHRSTNITKEEKPNKKSKNSFKIGLPDINLPTFGMKRGSKQQEKESSVSEEEDDKIKSKSKNFKFGFPSFEVESKNNKTTESDAKAPAKIDTKESAEKATELLNADEVEDNKNITTCDLKVIAPNLKLSGVQAELESNLNIESDSKGSINKTSDSIDTNVTKLDDSKTKDTEAEDTKKSSKKSFSINTPDISLSSLHIKLKGKKSSEVPDDAESKNNKKKSSSKGGFKIEAPDINIPSFSLKKRKSKDHNSDESPASLETEKSISDTEATLDTNVITVVNDEDVDKQDGGEDAKKSKKEKKKSKEKSGFNFKFKGTDFSFSNFGNKNIVKEGKHEDEATPSTDTVDVKSNVQEPKIDIKTEEMTSIKDKIDITTHATHISVESKKVVNEMKIEAIQVRDETLEEAVEKSKIDNEISNFNVGCITTKNIPELAVNLDLDVAEMNLSEPNILINDSTPSMTISDLEMSKMDIDQVDFLDVDGAEASALDTIDSIDKPEMNFDFNIPSFETPFGMKVNDEHSRIVDEHSRIIDELKAETDEPRYMESLEIRTMSQEESLEQSEIYAKDIKIPQISSPDLGFEDDKSKNGKHERGESSDYEMSMKLPEISQPKWSVKSNSSYEDGSASKNVSLDSNLPDIDTDLLDDESSEDLNITDATKKKRFGFKLRSPDLVMSEYLKSSLPKTEELKDVIDGNQSDEMKSFNLKLKTPNIQEGATAITSEPEIDYDDTDEITVKLPRLKVSSIKSKISSDEIVDNVVHLNLIENSSKQTKYNKSDEWKMQGVGDINIKSTSHDIGFSGANETPEDERDDKFNIDIDDAADFVIPDINSIPGYDINNLPDFELFDTKNIQISSGSTVVEYPLPEFDIKERRKIFEDGERLTEENIEVEVTKKDYLPDFQIDIAKSKFLNLSLESSELESDLPEADSDLKRAASGISEIDAFNTSVNNEKVESGNSFGNAFGFRGFKKHIEREEIQGREPYSASNEIDNCSENASLITEDSPKVITEGDLPEVDIHFDMQGQVKMEEKSINVKSLNEKVDSTHFQPSVDDLTDINFRSNDSAVKVHDGEEKNKSKSKLGIGFGFKGFSKSSDSEDTESSTKVSNEPEVGHQEIKEKNRQKAKKTFSFKGFVGKSSSDTEEEINEKISEKPMMDDGDEKVKLKNKTSLSFGFKQRSSKSSDSEDNIDSEKVESVPIADSSTRKQKIKSNLSFGFINKSKSETETTQFQQEASTKHDIKSESEGGEDDRPSMDTKADEARSKSKYGLNFGFRKANQKQSSDSEGGVENDESHVNLDERGVPDKTKDQKGKSLKLGFKGFKNLKGKIQNEINKMRHDSPSTDEDDKNEEHNHGEKRKKLPKKKEKEKKFKRESEVIMDASEEVTMASGDLPGKESSRRKRVNSKSSSTSSTSTDSSSDDEGKVIEMKKKKKTKNKRKDESRSTVSGLTQVELSTKDYNTVDVGERITFSERSIDVKSSHSRMSSSEETHVTVIKSEPADNVANKGNFIQQNIDVQSNPRRYVVVREMKLKKSAFQNETEEGNEIVEKVNSNKNILQPLYLEDRATFTNSGTDTDGANWGSDSDMEKRTNGINSSEASVNYAINKNHRHLTDSEELKRKTASLGDLSTLNDGAGMGSVLERAVSLDLKNASVEHPPLHIRRLQLPDSSATSIDEADEPSNLNSPKKLESNFGLKAASQWGTLEEALKIGIHSNEYLSNSSQMTTTFVRNTSVEDGEPVSNIEISGDSSLVEVSLVKNSWNENCEEDCPPSLPLSPVPVAPMTIAVKEKVVNKIVETVTTDSSIVVVGSDEIERTNNIHNVNVTDDHLVNDSSMVTITMVPAESHTRINVISPASVNNQKQSLMTTSTPPELTGFNSLQDASIVTINHDRLYENGELLSSESSEHNISDEFITPESTPQKSMTQITLEGDGGYTVTEGTISRTVILTRPEVESSILVQTDGRAHV